MRVGLAAPYSRVIGSAVTVSVAFATVCPLPSAPNEPTKLLSPS